ncbi:MAG: SMP-30/gluconolactonase/LRE family protein [Sphingobacteriales bacterium]
MRKKILRNNFVAVGAFLFAGMLLIESCSKKNDSAAAVEPQISSFVPSSAAKDSIVIISGKNFGSSVAGITVSFNGVAGSVLTASDGVLTVKVPVHAHDGKITVQANGKTGSSAGDFTYIYTVSTLAGDGTASIKEGAGAIAEFNYPEGITVNGSGNIYVADYLNSRIRGITPAGIVNTFAGDGVAAYYNATGVMAEFNHPSGVAADASGNTYVTDTDNNRIRKITAAGVVTLLAGDGTAGRKDSTGPLAKFNGPTGVAVDAFGNLYIADSRNQRIRKIAAPTTAGVVLVSTLAGDGTAAYREGADTTAQFNNPAGIAVDASGNVYVADFTNQRIRKITPAGVVSTLAGDGTPAYRDGTGTSAQFKYPAAVAVDIYGNVYVAEYSNNRIRKITPSGVVSTVAGDGTAAHKDGTGTTAQFNKPYGIAVDASGNIYVSDTYNQRIRKLQ